MKGTLLAFAALLVAVSQSGCLSSAPLPGVTAAEAPRVAACQSIAAEHNAFVIGDVVVGGLATGAGSVGAALSSTNESLKTGVLVGAAVATGLAMTGATLSGLTASDFANSRCSDVVGSLPDLPPAPMPAVAPADAGAPPAADAGHAELPSVATEFVVSLDPLRSSACQPCYARGVGCQCVGAECGCVP